MEKKNKQAGWPAGPTIENLKERFKDASVLLENDFADLIDLAEHGRAAVGKSQDQTGPANGFKLSANNNLELNLIPNGGLKASSEGLAAVAGNGIEINNNGIGIQLKLKDSGLYVDKANGLAILAQPDSGLEPAEKGIYVKANKDKGIAVNAGGVAVKLSANKGLLHNKDGVNLNLNKTKGITADSAGISIQDGMGVKFGVNGHLDIKAGKGITVDRQGVHFDYALILPKGVIMIFSGSKVPDGWALCDGDNGTPDLRDRFVLGSTGFTNIGQTNDKKVQGDDIDKKYSISSTESTTSISVALQGSSLTIDQMPAHTHQVWSLPRFTGKDRYCRRTNNMEDPKAYGGYETATTLRSGSGAYHSHDKKIHEELHPHESNIVPPYYILAYIMRL